MDHSSVVPLYICTPFVVILLLIAIMPLALPLFWEKNRNKAIITALVSLPVLLYLVFNLPHELWATGKDYFSFIVLLAALYIVAGGILITGDIRATPTVNAMFLLSGAVLANIVGTTGASILLIRPLLQTIRERKHISHIPVFFIFIVSNIGGSLTPLADPPLLMGYLRGVPFNWTFNLFPIWLTAVGVLLVIFYIWDTLCFRKETNIDINRDRVSIAPLEISGKTNIVLLGFIALTVALQIPAPYRELLMVVIAIASLSSTPKGLRTRNQFTFGPITEVAVLFAGIFITMIPLLMLLYQKGASFGITKPWQFFWLSGGLSSFLDNTPTYLTFSSLAQGVTRSFNPANLQVIAGVRVDLLMAISCGSVFMGANTYIGNAPNFMVKSIAEEQGVKVPHFFGYMVYSLSILIPVFLMITLVFFR